MSEPGRRYIENEERETREADYETWRDRMERFAPPEAIDSTLDADAHPDNPALPGQLRRDGG